MRKRIAIEEGQPGFWSRITGTSLWLTAAFSLLPAPLAPQLRSEVSVSPVPDGAALQLCSWREFREGEFWNTVLGALGSRDPEAWRPRVRDLEDPLALAARAAPSDLSTQYLYAVALGARTEVERGKEQVHKARELHGQVMRVLALDPNHAGALYIQGRLNAAVMRLSRVKRFVATKLLGGAVLSSASWDEARRLLEAAADRDPCVPDHHFELARVYEETGHPDLARDRLQLLSPLLSGDDWSRRMAIRARNLMARVEGVGGDG